MPLKEALRKSWSGLPKLNEKSRQLGYLSNIAVIPVSKMNKHFTFNREKKLNCTWATNKQSIEL